MKSNRRAKRRWHYQRLKHKRKKYWGGIKDEKYLGIVINTPHPCSCSFCSRKRKTVGETIQEKKAPRIEDWESVYSM